MKTISMVIPVIDEIDGMKMIMPQIKNEWVDEIIIIDGGSTDGTVEEAERLGYKIIHQKTKGLGDAYNLGIEAAKSDYILFFSPDGNHIPQDIPKMIEKINQGYDLVQINRFGKTSNSEDPGPITGFGNRMFTFLVNVFFGGRLGDTLDGFKIIKKEVLLGLKIGTPCNEVWEQQICIRALKAGNSICEIEGDEPKRIGGERKMKPFAAGIELSKQIIQEFIFWKF